MFFLFILFVLILLIITLKINIEIKNVNFILKEPKLLNSKQEKSLDLKENYIIKIKFKILNIIPIFKITITKKRVEKMNKQIKKIRKSTSTSDIKAIANNFNIKIKEFNLKAEIGLDSIMILIYIIPIICTIISTILSNQKVDKEKQIYEIQPIYNAR